jgi:hypothetical protein
MVEVFISQIELERALSSIQVSIDDLKTDIKEMKDDVDERFDVLNERRNSELQNKIVLARQEGMAEGRTLSIESRLDRQENWRLATIAPGMVALVLLIVEWLKGGK